MIAIVIQRRPFELSQTTVTFRKKFGTDCAEIREVGNRRQGLLEMASNDEQHSIGGVKDRPVFRCFGLDRVSHCIAGAATQGKKF